jgi:hypothetical protein
MITAVTMTDRFFEGRCERARPSVCRQFRYGGQVEYRGAKKGFFNGAPVLHNSRNDFA